MIMFHQSVDSSQAFSIAPNLIVDYPYQVTLYNAGSDPVYVGDASVDSSMGLVLQPGARETFRAVEPLYMRCASGQSTTMHVLVLKG